MENQASVSLCVRHLKAKTFANVDLAQEPLPIRPGMHYQMGGIKTDIDGRCWDPQGHWKALCVQLELRCLDLWSAFARTAGSESLFKDLQHPNALGMRVAASATAEYLTR